MASDPLLCGTDKVDCDACDVLLAGLDALVKASSAGRSEDAEEDECRILRAERIMVNTRRIKKESTTIDVHD